MDIMTKEVDTVYVHAYKTDNVRFLKVTVETFVSLFVYKTCNTENLKLKVVLKEISTQERFVAVDVSEIEYEIVDNSRIPTIATFSTWPVIVVGNTVVAGLSAISRQMIKSSGNASITPLLGFREACLMACSEMSIWTKFCEVDVISTVKNVLDNFTNFYNNDTLTIPADLCRFEWHLKQPVRMHNVYKTARIKNNDRLIKSNVPLDQLNIEHLYGEGMYMTLSDILLYPCYEIIFQILGLDRCQNYLPSTVVWFKNMEGQDMAPKIQFQIPNFPIIHPMVNINIVQENIVKQSLYTADPQRYKPQSRIYTRQNDIDNVLNVISNVPQKIVNDNVSYGHEIDFNWSTIPLEATPKSGALPQSRADRKCHQLESLVKAVLKIAKNEKLTIVDFCSGSGHLGILVATLLPNSEIILVENKEKSLVRAKERVLKMNLKNVTLLQCNLDYFDAHFDLGMALHACGVATDLVIQTCIKNGAHFVCCPCCYGGIHDCHHLKYPRSKSFRELRLNYKDYLILGHAADQTHDDDNAKTLQGYQCMNIVDTDRKWHAEECGYDVYLGKLNPSSCTPKNNLLVGIYKNDIVN